jgi:hypothetical protein
MRKEQLVRLAVSELGLDKQAAEAQRAGALRLLIKEARGEAQKHAGGAGIPKGLTGMLKADLQKHMEERGLELTDPGTEKDKTHERMIREIRHCEENRVEREMDLSALTLRTPRTEAGPSEEASGLVGVCFPDAEEDWARGDEPASLSARAS